MDTLYDLDPTIPQQLVDAAQTGTPALFPDTGDQNSLDVPDGLTAVIPATPPQAIANARALHDQNVYVGVGRCLETVRMREYKIPPRDPTAEISWEHSTIKHPETDPAKIPRGAVAYFLNGRDGHVVEAVGGGLSWTGDYRRPGYVDLAPLSALATWCGGRLVGWSEMLEGVDVWPNPKKPTPPPAPWTIEDRLAFIERRLAAAVKAGAPRRKIDALRTWRDRIKAHIADGAK